jgi:C-terminal processing protease CtpA/Prc
MMDGFRSLFASPEKPCGVGLVLREGTDGSLFVAEVIPDGPAELAGCIAVGDVLYEVNGANVYRVDARRVAAAVLGPEGTRVRLAFKRGARYADDRPFAVDLTRRFVHGAGKLELLPA